MRQKTLLATQEEWGAKFSPCGNFRYVLWRTWNDKKKKVSFIGLNPSTATADINDPTVTRCINYAKAWGYGGMFMLNLFAFRATQPANMKSGRRFDHAEVITDDPVGEENDLAIMVYHEAAKITVACWGTHGSYLGRDEHVLELPSLRRFGGKQSGNKLRDELHCMRVTKGGHPSHPLYLPKSLKPVPYGVFNVSNVHH